MKTKKANWYIKLAAPGVSFGNYALIIVLSIFANRINSLIEVKE